MTIVNAVLMITLTVMMMTTYLLPSDLFNEPYQNFVIVINSRSFSVSFLSCGGYALA